MTDLATTTYNTGAEDIESPDSLTLCRVIGEFRARETVGKAKYGATVDRADFSTYQWAQHAKEEAMDLILYLTRFMEEESARKDQEAHTFTVFCVSTEGHETTHIDAHLASSASEAAELARVQTSADWDEPLENIRVLGIAQGDVSILDWDDGRT